MFFRRDPDAGIGDREREHLVPRSKRGCVEAVTAGLNVDGQLDPAGRRELERVGEQVLEDLLQPMRIGEDRFRHLRRQGNQELDPLGQRGPEHALHDPAHDAQLDRLDVHLQLARLDPREVEDLIDQREQVLAARVDGRGVLHLLGVEAAVWVLREQAREDEDAVQRSAELVRHVGEELGLVARHQGQLARLVLQIRGPLRELCVGRLQLLQQVLGARIGRDGVQHHSDAVGELLQQHAMDGLEPRQRAELDHAPHFALEEHRDDQQAAGRRFPDAGADPHVVGGKLFDSDDPFLHGALPDEPLPRSEPLGRALARMAVGADPAERLPGAGVRGHEERRVLGANLWRKLAEHDPAQLLQASPSLQEP